MNLLASARATSLAIVLLVGAVPLLVCAALLFGHDARRAEAALPLHGRDRDYVGASACKACHPDHYESWRRTYHSTMTQLPSASTVLGHFDGTQVTFFGASATPFERDGRFYFRLPAIGGDGPREAEVALCVGSRRYQQYFERREERGGVTYRRLPLLWHVGEARWMHLNGAFLEPDNDDWSTHQATWNLNCIFCHNTGIAPGLRTTHATDDSGGASAFETMSKGFDSHVADLGIACEACHGPSREHVRRNTSLVARYRSELGSGAESDVVAPPRLGQKESAAMCGQCHSQRLPEPMDKIWTFLDSGPTFRPGDVLDGHVKPITRDTPVSDPRVPDAYRDRFWSDGTARLTGYEYLGVTQSPCFRGGIYTCGSCHTMHGGDIKGQITPEMRGDRACTQCHAGIGRNPAAHTHHAPSSSGSRCLECHMPRMVYGILAVHRSHRVESPDVKRDTEAGRPNACGECHLDKSPLWAADRMREFWGPRYERPTVRKDGAALDLPDALASVHAGDPVQRAVYEFNLGRSDGALTGGARGVVLGNALVGLGDTYGAVRFLARRAALDLDAALGLGLGDEIRAFDPQATAQQRERALLSLLRRYETSASMRLSAPPNGMMVERSYHLEFDRVSSLLDLQTGHQIETGE